MTFPAKNYRQFAHDLLNVAGRIQSVAELVEIDDETLRNMLNNDVNTLTRSIKLFSKLGWCQAQSELEETHPVDASSLVFEVVAADRPEGVLLAIDENIRIETDPTILKALIEELVHNVAAHANTENPAKIKLYKSTKGHVLELTNEACNPFPEDYAEPFTKGQNSRGLGLGLSFVTCAAELLKMPFNIEAEGQAVKATLVVKP
ncbi:MAG: hypothetical protein CMF62_08560 [Magnetococcales bacterium]|nr:hypothetical protein [Magnetococcales bacterium]